MPFVNLVFFVVLALAPPRVRVPDATPSPGSTWLPRSAWASAAAGVVLTALVGGTLALFATETLEHYGRGLFVGLAFCLGLLSALVYAHAEERSRTSTWCSRLPSGV